MSIFYFPNSIKPVQKLEKISIKSVQSDFVLQNQKEHTCGFIENLVKYGIILFGIYEIIFLLKYALICAICRRTMQKNHVCIFVEKY